MNIIPNQPVKVYFNDFVRTPVVGQFVELSDSKQLESKGMARFVSMGRLEDFEKTNHVMYTRIFSLKSLKAVDNI